MDSRELNKYLKREHFQLRTWEEIACRLSGGKYFSKLDANQGYWQITIDEESSRLTTFNTPFGRYRFRRMPFGMHSVQEVFHKRIGQHFADLEGVESDIDDILVWGTTIEEHDPRLNATLERAEHIGMTMNREKCMFRMTEVTYLGHKLPGEGVKPKLMQSSICQLPTTSMGCRDCSEWSTISQSSSQAPQRLPRWRRTCLGIGLRNVKLRSTRSKKLCPPVKSWDSSDVTKAVVLQTDASKRELGAVLLQEGFRRVRI